MKIIVSFKVDTTIFTVLCLSLRNQGGMSNIYKEAREAFKPAEVNVLFLAESPPNKPNRFFYFPGITTGDSLFLHLIREVFPELKNIETKQLRARKEELLLRFRDAGFWVLDSSDNVLIKGLTQSQKIKALKEEQHFLNNRIHEFKETTKIVLLSVAVFKANYTYLIEKGYEILNHSPIPFPGSGQQNNFKRAFAQLGI